MIEPKQYKWASSGMDEFKGGYWVEYADLVKLQYEVERLREILWPFAVYASALKGRDGLDVVHEVKQQSIKVFVFRAAAEAVLEEEAADEQG